MRKNMTELQLRIRRLAHKATCLRKLGKDVSAVSAELAELRRQRATEKSRPKVAEAVTEAAAETNSAG